MRITIISRCQRAIKVLFSNPIWLLEYGFWDDNGIWDDNEYWID